MDSGFQVLDSGFLVSGTWIPDSTTKICWIPDSISQNFPDSGIRNPLVGREVTLSGTCVPNKNTSCTVNSLPLFELYIGKYFEENIDTRK